MRFQTKYCVRGHRWSATNTYYYQDGVRRYCKQCQKERDPVTRSEGWLVPGRIPDQIMDLLQIHGGWKTAQSLATDLRGKEPTIERALWRLLKRRRVTRRKQFNCLTEWRAE